MSGADPVLPTSWRVEVPLTRPELPVDGAADRDGDGLSALLEYALGTSDTDPASGWDAIDYSVETEGDDSFFEVRFRPDPLVVDVVIQPEATFELEVPEWRADLLVEVGGAGDGDGFAGWRSFRLVRAIGRNAVGFVRLGVLSGR